MQLNVPEGQEDSGMSKSCLEGGYRM